MPTKKNPGSDETKKPNELLKQNTLPLSSSTAPKSGCCRGSASCESSHDTHHHASSLPLGAKLEPTKKTKTKVIIHYDVGFANFLSMRGNGANLNWDRGITLKNTRPDEWIWETDVPFTACEFKVLVNDHHYEAGHNHAVTCGSSIKYTPKF